MLGMLKLDVVPKVLHVGLLRVPPATARFLFQRQRYVHFKELVWWDQLWNWKSSPPLPVEVMIKEGGMDGRVAKSLKSLRSTRPLEREASEALWQHFAFYVHQYRKG